MNANRMKRFPSLLALLLVWLASAAATAGTNRPSFEVSQRLRAEGFTEVGVDFLKSLSVSHNSVGALTNELKSPPVLDVLTRGLSVEPSRLAAFEALGFEDAQWPNNAISAEIWWRLPEATSSEVHVIQGRLKRYVDCRWEGHTAKYALESLNASSKARPYPGSPWGSILRAHPDIPPRWLVPVTNETRTVRVPAERLARRGITAQPGEMVELNLTNYLFKVVDGPVTWHYDSQYNGMRLPPSKSDSQEDDPAKAEIFRQVKEEVEAWMKANSIQGLGRAHRFWGEQKRILKERHGIDWKSPSELSPFVYSD